MGDCRKYSHSDSQTRVRKTANVPENVLKLMKSPGTVKVLVTASKNAKPHAIVAGSINSPKPDTMIIGEVLMKVSAKNLSENPSASFLVSAGTEAYEINCTSKARLDKGPELDAMNAALAAVHLKATAVWVFGVDAVFDQSASPNAGKKLA